MFQIYLQHKTVRRSEIRQNWTQRSLLRDRHFNAALNRKTSDYNCGADNMGTHYRPCACSVAYVREKMSVVGRTKSGQCVVINKKVVGKVRVHCK
jgi:hypothetical protein